MAGETDITASKQLNAQQRSAFDKLKQAGHEAFDQENYRRALDNYHRASLLDGSAPEIWWSLGLAYGNLGFPHEAWRSFKLALLSGPESAEALWYAAEFLYNLEDFAIAALLLERYVALEEDPEKLEEAREMLLEAKRNAEADVRGKKKRVVRSAAATSDDEEEEEEDDDLEGFEVDDEEAEDADDDWDDEEDEDFDDEDEDAELLTIEDDEDGERTLGAAGEFVASMTLVLTGMEGKCAKCATPIPLDAPYCYSCQAPHFYREG